MMADARNRSHIAVAATLAAGILVLASCAEAPDGRPEAPLNEVFNAGPRVVVLGTAQDGGLPHAACDCPRCEAARRSPELRRRVASLAVVPSGEERPWLVDATPDVVDQLRALRPADAPPHGKVDRSPLGGVLLTHAHMGHYIGLAHFGFEAVHVRGLPVGCTPRMARFLEENQPWRQLVTLGNVALNPLPPGATRTLAPGLEATAVAVPHRDELSDTVGYIIRGPTRTILYVPDTEPWERWPRPIEELLDGVDVALLDGTFYSADELPGRDVASIGHPLVVSTMDRLGPLVAGGRLAVWFTHLNHSNPALDPASPARREIERRGFGVLDDGQVFGL